MLATIERTELMEIWPLMRLRVNPLNPRGLVDPASVEELAASMRSQGILQPLLIIPDGTVVAGHRRLAAAFLACLHEVPVVIRDLAPIEQLEIMLAENLQRADLTPIQEARAYRALLDAGCRQTDVARRVGVPTARVQNRLTLLKLDPQVQRMFETGELPTGLGPVLAKISDPAQQRRLAMLVGRRRLSVLKVEQLIAQGQLGPAAKPVARIPIAAVKPTADEDEDRPKRLGRPAAIDLLKRAPGRSISFSKLAEVMDDTCGICGECGMAGLETVCAECPLPQLVGRLMS